MKVVLICFSNRKLVIGGRIGNSPDYTNSARQVVQTQQEQQKDFGTDAKFGRKAWVVSNWRALRSEFILLCGG